MNKHRYRHESYNAGRGVYKMFEGGSNANKQLLPCIYYWDEPDDPSGSVARDACQEVHLA